ncbi:MAG TPA: hypothetical protein VN697_13720 [Tepidiformaceae bacterium]|nr:hypothetical protein [Tepidiformaceae bacterium]
MLACGLLGEVVRELYTKQGQARQTDIARDSMAEVKLEKRIERMRESTSVDPAELHSIPIALGFGFRPAKGDHRLYFHPRLRFPVGVDPRQPLLPVYVRKALIAIDEVMNDAHE